MTSNVLEDGERTPEGRRAVPDGWSLDYGGAELNIGIIPTIAKGFAQGATCFFRGSLLGDAMGLP